MLGLIALVLSLWTATPVLGQSCGPDNPNCVAPTPPVGDNSNRIATTAFVTSAVGGGSPGGSGTVLGTSVVDLGVDCTGVADATSLLQTYWNANKNGHLFFPYGCNVKITNTITLTNGIGPSMVGGTQGTAGNTPRLQWSGAFHGVMFNFVAVDTPVIENLQFGVDMVATSGYQCPDTFLNFDGATGPNVGTRGRIRRIVISADGCRDRDAKYINISETATTNHENYLVEDVFISCGGTGMAFRMGNSTATANGTTTITAASAPFFAGMAPNTITAATAPPGPITFTTSGLVDGLANQVVHVTGATPAEYNGDWFVTAASGHSMTLSMAPVAPWSSGGNIAGMRLRVSHPGGKVDTTTASFVSTTQITVADTIPWTDAQTQIWAGSQGFGIGIRNGASQNAIQQQFKNVIYQNCSEGIHLQGGSAQITQPTGGSSDVGVFIGGFLAQNTSVDFYASESDNEGIIVSGGAVPAVQVTNGRFSNGNQLASGFVTLGANVLFESNVFNFAPPTNSILVSKGTGGSQNVVSQANLFSSDWNGTGLGLFTNRPIISIRDNFDSTNAPGENTIGCFIGNSAICLNITYAQPGNTASFASSFDVYSTNSTSSMAADAVGIRSRSDLGFGAVFSSIRAQPTIGRLSASQTLVEAAWNKVSSIDVTNGMSAGYGFRANTLASVIGGTLANMYGYYCDQQKIANVTNGYCFYSANINDINSFAGGVTTVPTTVGSLPACNTANKGRRMFVTDGNTANAFRGAVTAGGTNNQWVTCDGTSWLQG
jgi:hypothetical protein